VDCAWQTGENSSAGFGYNIGIMVESFDLYQAENGRPAPAFQLPSNRNGLVDLSFYRSRSNIVLFFASSSNLGNSVRVVNNFSAREDDYWFQNAQVLIVWPTSKEGLPDESISPYPILADETGRIRRKYLDMLPVNQKDACIIFVLDRFGSPYAGLIGDDLRGNEIQDEVLGWLDYIGLQCPE